MHNPTPRVWCEGGEKAYKFLKFVASGEEALDGSLKYVLERCYFEFIKDVGLSGRLLNRNRAEKSYGGKLESYIPNPSERSQLGAFLAAQLIGGRHKFIDGGMHSMERPKSLPQVERKTQAHKFTCKLCPHTNTTQAKINVHMIRHQTHKCHVCSKVFKTNKHLDKHFADEHPKVQKYRCSICKKAFVAQGTLDLHNRTFHLPGPGEGKQCRICGGIFMVERQLLHHIDNVHSKDFKGCKECGIVCGTGQLRTHNEKHHKGEPGKYKCTKCEKTCNTRKLLTQHVRDAHRNTQYTCYMCGQNFTRRHNMGKHFKKCHL